MTEGEFFHWLDNDGSIQTKYGKKYLRVYVWEKEVGFINRILAMIFSDGDYHLAFQALDKKPDIRYSKGPTFWSRQEMQANNSMMYCCQLYSIFNVKFNVRVLEKVVNTLSGHQEKIDKMFCEAVEQRKKELAP
jgi:hypothetical protein